MMGEARMELIKTEENHKTHKQTRADYIKTLKIR